MTTWVATNTQTGMRLVGTRSEVYNVVWQWMRLGTVGTSIHVERIE